MPRLSHRGQRRSGLPPPSARTVRGDAVPAFEEVKTIVTVPLLLFTGVASFSAWFVITILFRLRAGVPLLVHPSLDWGQMWLPVLFGSGDGAVQRPLQYRPAPRDGIP